METISRTCPNCGKAYLADAGRLKHGRQTACGRGCSYALRATARKARVALKCPVCHKDFLRRPSGIKSKHAGVYCSRACHYAGRGLGLTKRVLTKPYAYSPESKAAMLAASRVPKGLRTKHRVNCANCGTVKHDPAHGRKRVSGLTFCSLACCNAYRTGPNNPAWRGGHLRYYGPTWRPARRAARQRDGHQCRRCGSTSKRAVDVHHIVPFNTFASSADANRLDNLVSLCHACHMHVEWHGIDFPL